MSDEKAPRFSVGDRVLVLGNDEHEGRIVGWHNDSAIVELAQPIVTAGGDIFSTVVAHTGNFGTLGGPFSDSVYKAEIRRLRRMYLDTANELAGLRDGAFQAHEQHDADQAENARLTAELTALRKEKEELRTEVLPGGKVNYTQMAEGFIQIPEEKWDAVQAELTALRNRYSTECPVCGGSGMAEEHNCPRCNGTGRVMMLDAEEVGARVKASEEAAKKYGNPSGLTVGAAYRIVLEGKR